MDFLAASQNADNNNTHKIPCYVPIRLSNSNSTQMQTREIQNQEVFFQLKPLSDRKRKYNPTASFYSSLTALAYMRGKISGNFNKAKSRVFASNIPVKLAKTKISNF